MSRASDRANIAERTAVEKPYSRRWIHALSVFVLLSAAVVPLWARSTAQKKQVARTEFETAEGLRDALNEKPAAQRKDRDYKRVIDAYRRVYYTAPTSSKADPAVFAVAELLVEEGRAFKSPHALQEAVGQYEFLRKEYPGSKFRVQALFKIAQIYKDDLGDNDQARETLQEFLKHYPHSEFGDDARQALNDLDDAIAQDKRNASKNSPRTGSAAAIGAGAAETRKPDLKSPEVKAGELQKVELKSEDTSASDTPQTESHHGNSLVTGIRHWSTPDYTRIAVDLENEVKWDSGRIPHPDRIYFDLKDTRLSAVLKNKSFDVDDGFLKRIRIAQFAPGLTRVVLEVGDDVSEYSAFLLPNPFRLVIDIHGRRPATLVAKNEKQDVPAKAVEPPSKPADKPAPKESQNETTVAKVEPPAKLEPAKAESTNPEVKEAVATKSSAKPVETAAVSMPPAIKTTSTESKPVSASTETAKQIDDSASRPAVISKVTPPEIPPVKDPATTSRGKKHSTEKITEAKVHEAQPTSDGDRSLIRALGLKIGRIVIDAGHGGHDTGTIGPEGVREKDIVLDVALKLGKLLENRLGAEVVYTRDDDTFIPLETRTAIANQQQADLFVSIHANSSSDRSARGVETYYLNFTSSRDALEVAARENAVSQQSIHELQDLVKKIALKDKIEESRELAADVQQSLHTGLSGKSPAIRDRGVKKAPFIVLIGANMPSILAEISFISNPTDEKKLETSDYRQKIAESLYKGIAKYVGGLSGIKVAAKMNGEPGD